MSWLTSVSHECNNAEIMILIQVCPEAEAPDRNGTYYKYVGALTALKKSSTLVWCADSTAAVSCRRQGVGGAQEDDAPVRAAHARPTNFLPGRSLPGIFVLQRFVFSLSRALALVSCWGNGC